MTTTPPERWITMPAMRMLLIPFTELLTGLWRGYDKTGVPVNFSGTFGLGAQLEPVKFERVADGALFKPQLEFGPGRVLPVVPGILVVPWEAEPPSTLPPEVADQVAVLTKTRLDDRDVIVIRGRLTSRDDAQAIQETLGRTGWRGTVLVLAEGVELEQLPEDEQRRVYQRLRKRFEGRP